MPRRTRHTILLILLLLISGQVIFSQSGFFIPKSGKVFFTGDSSTIFSDVINRGNLGVGKNALVNFSGKTWENDPQSLITDESNGGAGTTGEGGWIRFLSETVRQQVWGGYNAATKSGATFSKIKIQNKAGVELLNGSMKVRREINFARGLFYLHDQIMVIGNNDPGIISGYDSAHYFITGNKAGSGLLMRENLRRSNGLVTFPIGSAEHAYTPGALRVHFNTGDDFYMSVFDSTRKNGNTGFAMTTEGVNKTWQAGKRATSGIAPVDITLQHLNGDEGADFMQNRQYAFVSAFTDNAWDVSTRQAEPVPGYLATGPALKNSGVNTRNSVLGQAGSLYFTKLTGRPAAPKTRLWFNAYRLDTGHVKVYWNTNPEINVKTFIVQRRLANEAGFRTVGSLPSKAVNGYSNIQLDYLTTDINNYKGISFYRLMLVPYSGLATYSDTVAVGPIPGLYSIMLWPNPTPDVFYLSLHRTLNAKSIVIWNVLGQKVKQEEVNGRVIIQMHGLLPGTYFVSIVLVNGEIIETKKLVVVGG